MEFGAQTIDKTCRQYKAYQRNSKRITQKPNDAIEELNLRFGEAMFGYQYEDGKIFRMDSQLIHAEVTKPALQLLSDHQFTGPHEEFLKAHEFYRAREYEPCITEALKAFESALKTICHLKKWDYEPGARASDLIKVVRKKLLPDYLDPSFEQLIAALKSGLPKVRDKQGAHGQGPVPRETPDFVAAYALHLLAANIVLLVDAFRATEN